MKRSIDDLKTMVASAEARYRSGRATGTPLSVDVRKTVAVEVARCSRAGEGGGSIPDEVVRNYMRLRDHLGFDDLDMVGLALGLEAVVNLCGPLDLTTCVTVEDVVRALTRAMGPATSAREGHDE